MFIFSFNYLILTLFHSAVTSEEQQENKTTQ